MPAEGTTPRRRWLAPVGYGVLGLELAAVIVFAALVFVPVAMLPLAVARVGWDLVRSRPSPTGAGRGGG